MRDYFFILILALILFFPFLGSTPLLDTQETIPAQISKEMLESKRYAILTLGNEEYTEHPPLFNWFQGLSFKLLGTNERAARIPNAICSIFTLLFIFHFANKYFNKRLGFWWVLSYLACLLAQLSLKSGVIDPWFNFFLFASIAYLYKSSLKNNDWIDVSIAGIYLGLAILVKGTFALGILIPCGIFVNYFRKRKHILHLWQVLVCLAMALSIAFIWYGIVFYNYGFNTLFAIIKSQMYQVTSGDSFQWKGLYYHSFILLLGCFPASLFMWDSFQQQNLLDQAKNDFIIWMRTILIFTLIWVSVLHTFSFLYSSVCYLPLTFLSAYSLSKLETQQLPWRKTKVSIIIAMGILLGLFLIAIPFFGNYEKFIVLNIKNEFLIKILQNDSIKWYPWESVFGLLFIIAIILAGTWIAAKKYTLGTMTLFISSIVILQIGIYIFIPKIERYFQGDTRAFIQKYSTADSSVKSILHNNYLTLFYGNNSKIEPKEIYGFGRVTDKDKIQKEYPTYQFIEEKNGYVFYKIE